MESFKTYCLFLFFLITTSANAQCWKVDEVPKDFKTNTVLTLDSFIVSEKIVGVLDHAIALSDSFNVNHNETWLFYAICFRFNHDSLGRSSVRVELRQGTDYETFEFHSYFDNLEPFGAFCYKGFTFFVLAELNKPGVYKDFFKATAKKDFPVYYNKPEISEKWVGLDYSYTEKFTYLFYRYKEGVFYYIDTKPFN